MSDATKTTIPVLLQVTAAEDELQPLHVESANGVRGSDDDSLTEVVISDSNLEPLSKYLQLYYYQTTYRILKYVLKNTIV